MNTKKTLVQKINRSMWWHVPPNDPKSYKKRGKFLASTYKQAEFYGRPKDFPERVNISNLLYGFSETEILQILFPKTYRQLSRVVSKDDDNWYKRRIKLDAKMYRQAKKLKYDAIVLISGSAKKYIAKKRKPYSIELNLINF